MRFYLKLFLTVGITCSAMFANGGIGTKGDDLFPWPWGSECPFPWKNISGSYVVQTKEGGTYSGHTLEFQVDGKAPAGKSLHIRQYDRRGRLFAEGVGQMGDLKRILGAVLTPTSKIGTNYAVFLRTYDKNMDDRCSMNQRVTAVSFCRLDTAAKCTNNSLLEKLDVKSGE